MNLINEKVSNMIDTETGEILSSKVTSVVAMNRIINPEKGYKFKSRSKKMNLFRDTALPKELSWVDKGRLLELARCARQDTGVLARVSKRNIYILQEKDLYEQLGFSNKRSGKAFIIKLQKYDLLRKIVVKISNEEQEEQWYLSPLFFSSVYINKMVYTLWKDQLGTHIPNYVKRWFEIDGKD